MTSDRIQQLLMLGENIAVEFKRCGNGIEFDTYQTVCSFLNRFGGDILLGVEDNGHVAGLPPKAVPDMVKNFISTISNPSMFLPNVYLVPQVVEYDGRTLIHIHVPRDAEIYRLKGVVYDRVGDADVKVISSGALSELCIRKQSVYTEQKVYPYVQLEDLRLDLLPLIRTMAQNHQLTGMHPWAELTDMELLKSAGLYRLDEVTGKRGFCLAAIMLLGKDELIQSVCPNYKTDALLKKVNVDRYDDRSIVQTNLVDSYRQLTDFAAKHLLDKFFLEGQHRLSLAGIITREMIANTLIHREYLSHYAAKMVIMKDKMYVENACRARQEMDITPENLEPESKNPLIAGFFRSIGLADELGSGVRRLFKYVPLYSNAQPTMREADVFRITIPLNDLYSFDALTVSDSTDDLKPVTKLEATNMEQLVTPDRLERLAKNPRMRRLLQALEQERGNAELLEIIQLADRRYLRQHYLKPLLEAKWIEQTLPGKPTSRQQKYHLTTQGLEVLRKLQNQEQKLHD